MNLHKLSKLHDFKNKEDHLSAGTYEDVML